MKTIIVSLGGNALTPPAGTGTFEELQKNIQAALRGVVEFVKKGYHVALVSGSGPQIGALLLQNELSKGSVPQMPLHVLDAELEGELGYLIQQSVRNLLEKKRIIRPVVTILTQVLVNKNDPAFKHPTKPVGRYYPKSAVHELTTKGYAVGFEPGRGYRRRVASPHPQKIVEIKTINYLLQKKVIVIAAGGGGIPVIHENRRLKGIEGVIDKDAASSLLGRCVGARLLLILTNVDYVYENYATKNQKKIKKMRVKRANELLRAGTFGSGTMRPKIRAAVDFLNGGGKKVIITTPQKALQALNGTAGTHIVP